MSPKLFLHFFVARGGAALLYQHSTTFNPVSTDSKLCAHHVARLCQTMAVMESPNMKLSNHSSSRRFLFSSFLITLLSLLSVRVVQANPYASCVTNDNGTIRFVINESGGTVTVVYDDGTTNSTFDGV